MLDPPPTGPPAPSGPGAPGMTLPSDVRVYSPAGRDWHMLGSVSKYVTGLPVTTHRSLRMLEELTTVMIPQEASKAKEVNFMVLAERVE